MVWSLVRGHSRLSLSRGERFSYLYLPRYLVRVRTHVDHISPTLYTLLVKSVTISSVLDASVTGTYPLPPPHGAAPLCCTSMADPPVPPQSCPAPIWCPKPSSMGLSDCFYYHVYHSTLGLHVYWSTLGVHVYSSTLGDRPGYMYPLGCVVGVRRHVDHISLT